jgi:hypothetical protein
LHQVITRHEDPDLVGCDAGLLGERFRILLRHHVLLEYEEALTKQHNVTFQEDLNLKVHGCKNLTSHSLQYLSCISVLMEMHAEIMSEPNSFGCFAAFKQTFCGLNV